LISQRVWRLRGAALRLARRRCRQGYPGAVREIAPGIWHWTARHEHIGVDVSSYYLAAERVLVDPMVPAEGVEWFEQHGPPREILLTNRHHDRHAWRLRELFGCTVHCIRNGLHELEGRGPVEPFEFGDQLPGGAVAYEVGAICPDETALHLPAHGALACADGVIHYGDELGFVPEQYMDNPEETKRALRRAYAGLLDLEFDTLLVAHGTPVVGGAKESLRKFATVEG
jgi:glyoxylase-like metal-dependent hydrolase (beta-lactamase superfamily II)